MTTAEVQAELRALAKGLGIRRIDLERVLGKNLREIWYISAKDELETVRAKVTLQLEWLIARLDTEEYTEKGYQNLARVSFNMAKIGETRTLVEEVKGRSLTKRQQALADRSDISSPNSTSECTRDWGHILKYFAEHLINNRPAPISLEELRNFLETGVVAADRFAESSETASQISLQPTFSRAGPRTYEPAVKTILRCDPVDLGVHNSIDTEPGQPLPPYVMRAHDKKLRGAISAGGSTFVVLIGNSSTGKSRACYEAAVECLPSWVVYQPRDAKELLELLTLHAMEPYGLVWLDMIDQFLSGDVGAEIATQLIHLLTDGPQPVVVLGSTWKRTWLRMSGYADNDREESASTVIALLEHARTTRIYLPATFSEASDAEFEELKYLASKDTRLKTALTTSGPHRKVTQVLAGGTLLVDFYEHLVDDHTHAIIHAAIDARRLGHHSPIPGKLLERAAPGYLSSEQRVASDDWFAAAISSAVTKSRGVSILAPVQMRDSIGPSNLFELHDYFYEYGERIRRGQRPPGSLWDAIVSDAYSASEQYMVSLEAQSRYLYQHSLRLALLAAEGGEGRAYEHVARLLAKAERASEAKKWQQMAERRKLAEEEERNRQKLAELPSKPSKPSYEDLSIAELKSLAESGDKWAVYVVRNRLYHEGRHEEKESWLQHLAELGNAAAMHCLAESMEERGVIAAWRLYKKGADAGNPFCMLGWAQCLEGIGFKDKAIVWYQRYLEDREAIALTPMDAIAARENMLNLVMDSGRVEKVTAVLSWLMKPGIILHSTCLTVISSCAVEAGIGEEALAWAQSRAEEGEPDAIKCAVRLFDRLGRSDESIIWLRELVARGHKESSEWLIRKLEERGRTEEAIAAGYFGIELDHKHSMGATQKILKKYGRLKEAEQLERVGILPGGWSPKSI